MSNTAFPPADVQLLEQIVSDPRFRKIVELGWVVLPAVFVLLGAYLVFGLSSWLYLEGHVPYMVTLVVSALAIFAVFTPLHDATHRATSKNPVLNDCIGNAAAFLLVPGFTTGLYRHLHLDHHRHTGIGNLDPDEPFVTGSPLALFLRWMFADVHWVLWYYRRRSQRPAAERRGYWLGLAFAVTWHIAWLSSPLALEFVLLWVIPQRVGLTILVYLFAHIQHPDGVEQQDYPFQATRMMRGGLPVRLLLLGQSEHLMHHMFPSVPFSRYHRAWMFCRESLKARELVWQWPFTKLQMPVLAKTPSDAGKITALVTSTRQVAEDVITFELQPVGRLSFPAFEPGAHIDVHVAPGVIRQYSLCGNPRDSSRYWLAVKREADGRGGSKKMHEDVGVGCQLEIGHPRNLFPLDPAASRYVLVAGGIGITPLLAMAHTLSDQHRPFTLHLCSRSKIHAPFHKELFRERFASRVKLHLDDAAADQRFQADDLGAWQQGAVLYICGPRGFMDWVIGQAKSKGWPDVAIKTESFVARVSDPSNARPFEVILSRSGKKLKVPSNRSLLDVLLENQIPIAASCTQGLCGACVTGVVSGQVDHRDHFLSDKDRASGKKITACVSRACSNELVLDL